MKYYRIGPLVSGLLLLACAPKNEKAAEMTMAATPTVERVSAERGAYLVNAIGCADCHSPKMMSENGPVPNPDLMLSGHPATEALPPVDMAKVQGYALFSMGLTAAIGPWGTSFAANITPDETGIGSWSEEQFLRSMKEGQWRGLEGTRKLLPPMPWTQYRNLSDDDLKSIFAYLKTLKPVKNVVPLPIPPAKA